MNNKAKSLGCKNSNFVNPHGFHDDNHYTTAYDMYLIMNEVIKNNDLLKIINTKTYSTDTTSLNNSRILQNTNILLENYEYMYGGKTGYTEEAGKTFVAYAKNATDKYIICMFNELNTSNVSPKFEDTKKLLDYAFANFKTKTIIKRNTKVSSIIDYNLLLKKDFFILNDIQMTIPVNFDNIIMIEYDFNLDKENMQVNCNINGTSTLLEYIVDIDSTPSTTISKPKVNIIRSEERRVGKEC